MVFIRGLKGKNGISDIWQRQGSLRRQLYASKGSKKSPATPATPATPVTPSNAETIQQLLSNGGSNANIPRNLNGSFDNIASSSATAPTPAAREQLPRASKDSSRVQFNVEPLSDDGSDGDAYVEHEQLLTLEQERSYILYQYINLKSPDPEEWDDLCGEMGTISLIEEASLGRVKDRTLFRRKIRRVLTKIRECWDDGADYCPKNNKSSGRPPKIEVNSAVANMIADLHEKNHLSVAMITHLLNMNRIVNPTKTVYRDCQVYSCINRMKPLRRAFHKRKQGDLSVNSAWAKARLNLCAHLGVRMGL